LENFKKIMVAIDLSSYSPQTMRYASDLARKSQAEVIIAHIINKRVHEAMEKMAQEIPHISVAEFLEHRTNDRKRRVQELVHEADFGDPRQGNHPEYLFRQYDPQGTAPREKAGLHYPAAER